MYLERADQNNLADLEDEFLREKRMILGEGVFFSLSILIGSILVILSWRRREKLIHQQNNFVLAVTHELKSPISAIMLAFQTMARKNLKEEQKQMLMNQGISESKRLNQVVDNILITSRIDSRSNLNLNPIDVSKISHEILDHFSKIFPDYLFTWQIAESIIANVDTIAFQAIVKNLVENSVKYSEPGTEIKLDLNQNDKNIVLKISDQGYGIPSEERKKIFDKFYRIGDENTRASKGTGLGLYIVSQFVRGHKGKITVSPNSPKGTVFKIIIPNEVK
jgi:K+-sensing histidine kinase KdpD